MKPQYKRLVIGQVEGQKPKVKYQQPGDLSRVSHLANSAPLRITDARVQVPYGEPTWLNRR